MKSRRNNKSIILWIIVLIIVSYPFGMTVRDVLIEDISYRFVDESYYLQGKKFDFLNIGADYHKVKIKKAAENFISIFDQITDLKVKCDVRKSGETDDGLYKARLIDLSGNKTVDSWTFSEMDVEDRCLTFALKGASVESAENKASMKGHKYSLEITYQGDGTPSLIFYQYKPANKKSSSK